MDNEDFLDRAGAAITPCSSAVSAHGSLTIGNTEDHVPEYGSSIATGNLENKMSSPRAVREFADWAFGAEGIPDLPCWDLVDDNMDMLSACAVDPIMVP